MSIEYTSNLPEVLSAIARNKIRTLTTIGLFVEGEAKDRCTVDTGNLRASIDHRVNSDNDSVSIGTNVEYAIFVEKGTRFMRDQPFLTPAVEENKDKIERIVEEGMRLD